MLSRLKAWSTLASRLPSVEDPDVAAGRQAEAFLEHAETEKLDCKIVMRDLDGKFSKLFDKVFKDY